MLLSPIRGICHNPLLYLSWRRNSFELNATSLLSISSVTVCMWGDSQDQPTCHKSHSQFTLSYTRCTRVYSIFGLQTLYYMDEKELKVYKCWQESWEGWCSFSLKSSTRNINWRGNVSWKLPGMLQKNGEIPAGWVTIHNNNVVISYSV